MENTPRKPPGKSLLPIYLLLLICLTGVVALLIWAMTRPNRYVTLDAPPEVNEERTLDFGKTADSSSATAGTAADSAAESELRMQEGKALAQQGKHAAAAEKFAEAVNLQPDNSEAHKNLAQALFRDGQHRKAALHFGEAARLNPRDTAAWNGQAAAFLKSGRIIEGEEKLTAFIAKNPNDAEAHYLLGTARSLLLRPEEAVASFREALRLEPEHAEALNALAWILATHPHDNLRNGLEAVQLAEQACRLDASRPAFLGTLDAAYAETGRFDEAIATAKKASALAVRLGDAEAAEFARVREERYQQKQPFRDQTRRPN